MDLWSFGYCCDERYDLKFDGFGVLDLWSVGCYVIHTNASRWNLGYIGHYFGYLDTV